MSVKMNYTSYWKELTDIEEEIKHGFWWKFKKKKTKKLILARIAFLKSCVSITIKTIDCLKQNAESI